MSQSMIDYAELKTGIEWLGITAKVIRWLNSILTGLSSNSVHGRQFPNAGKVRSQKSTHISRINNSVTLPQSFTNTAIANITGNPALIANIAIASADIGVTSWDFTDHVLWHWRLSLEHRMFHNVFQVFHDVLRCFMSVSCLTIVYNDLGVADDQH